MGRPRLDLDCERIDELREKGYGARRIAKEVGASRSTVMRYLSSKDDGSAHKTGSEPGSGPTSRGDRQSVTERQIRDDPRRDHARELVGIRRRRASDAQFAAALQHLDELLLERPTDTAFWLANLATDWLRSREAADQRAIDDAERAQEAWRQDAKRDLASRWETEVRLLLRRLPIRAGEALDELEETARMELSRAEEVLMRRMSAMEPGTPTLTLSDSLVSEGLERLVAAAEALS